MAASQHFYHLTLPPQRKRRKIGGEWKPGVQRVITSFRLEVGDAVHDHMVQKQGLVVHFDGAREQAAEIMHVPGAGRGAASARMDKHPSGNPRRATASDCGNWGYTLGDASSVTSNMSETVIGRTGEKMINALQILVDIRITWLSLSHI